MGKTSITVFPAPLSTVSVTGVSATAGRGDLSVEFGSTMPLSLPSMSAGLANVGVFTIGNISVPLGSVELQGTADDVTTFTTVAPSFAAIPATISVTVGGTTSLSSYVYDPSGLVTSSQLLENGGALVSTSITYAHDSGNYTITGVSEDTVSNLTLEITY